MPLEIKAQDKDRTSLEDAPANGVLNLDFNDIGIIQLTSDYEFGIQHFIIGPGSITYDVKVEMNLNPDRSIPAVWGRLFLINRVTLIDLEVYKKIFAKFDSFKNDVRISITNKHTGLDRKFYYYVSASSREAMPHRRY